MHRVIAKAQIEFCFPPVFTYEGHVAEGAPITTGVSWAIQGGVTQ